MSSNAAKRLQIRQQMRQRRAGLDFERQTKASAAVVENLEKIEILHTAGTVAGYRCVRGEVNIDEVLSRLIARGATVTVPRVVDDDLEFVEWSPAAATSRGAFGISEPVGSQVLDLGAHDAVLAPVVAFDHTGARIGQGGGFYDRCFGRLGDKRPALIGIAHAFQEVEQIPTEPWDIPLDAVVTDTRVTVFRSGTL